MSMQVLEKKIKTKEAKLSAIILSLLLVIIFTLFLSKERNVSGDIVFIIGGFIPMT